jgi:hypothetical protein
MDTDLENFLSGLGPEYSKYAVILRGANVTTTSELPDFGGLLDLEIPPRHANHIAERVAVRAAVRRVEREAGGTSPSWQRCWKYHICVQPRLLC